MLVVRVQQNPLGSPSHWYDTLLPKVSPPPMNSVTLEVECGELTETAGACIRSLLGEGVGVEATILVRRGHRVCPMLLRMLRLRGFELRGRHLRAGRFEWDPN